MDLLWPFRRKVSILIPNTPEFYDLYENDHYYQLRGFGARRRLIISNPNLHLRLEIIQILEIFGIPYRLRGTEPKELINNSVTYDYDSDLPTKEECIRFSKRIRDTMNPRLIVRAKDFIEVNAAIQKYIGEVQSATENKAS